MALIVGLADVGVLCALGRGKSDVHAALLAGSLDGMRHQERAAPDRDLVLGRVDGALDDVALPAFRSRNNQLALTALAQIRGSVDAAIARVGAARVGVVIGTSTSGIAEGGEAVRAWTADQQLPPDFTYNQQEPGSAAELIATVLGVGGPALTVSTACTSSARALITARRWIAAGLCDVVIAGGVDTLCDLTIRGFLSIDAVSRGACRPFAADRDGINLGEAAALFLVTREPSPVSLLGAGSSSDAYHMSSPDPAATGAILAMQRALTDAGQEASAVRYVNLHGTATRHNDAMEALAVATVLGDAVPCSSTKPMTGHTLGAAGALEAALCWLMLSDPARRLPPQLASEPRDPELPTIALAALHAALPGANVVMSNSFAFGGNNTSLILGVST